MTFQQNTVRLIDRQTDRQTDIQIDCSIISLNRFNADLGKSIPIKEFLSKVFLSSVCSSAGPFVIHVLKYNWFLNPPTSTLYRICWPQNWYTFSPCFCEPLCCCCNRISVQYCSGKNNNTIFYDNWQQQKPTTIYVYAMVTMMMMMTTATDDPQQSPEQSYGET